MNWKEIAKTAAICAGVVYAYHAGLLNFIPMFAGSKELAK